MPTTYSSRDFVTGTFMTKYGKPGVILLPVQSVGVMGDERTYERAVALRAVTSTDAMTADWAHLPYDFMAKVSNDIINKVKGVNRVCYDISSKPPATIEWGVALFPSDNELIISPAMPGLISLSRGKADNKNHDML